MFHIKKIIKVKIAQKPIPIKRLAFAPLTILLNFLAPKFCAVKVAVAVARAKKV